MNPPTPYVTRFPPCLLNTGPVPPRLLSLTSAPRRRRLSLVKDLCQDGSSLHSLHKIDHNQDLRHQPDLLLLLRGQPGLLRDFYRGHFRIIQPQTPDLEKVEPCRSCLMLREMTGTRRLTSTPT